jgi:hypothetical protein
MGNRKEAERVVETALSELFSDDEERTEAETSLINDLSSLRQNLTAAQLEVLARAIRGIKKLLEERENSN